MDVKTARETAGLTQADAARAARISVATWRRAEDDLSSVSAKTRMAVERVLKTAKRTPHGKAQETAEPAEHVKRLNTCFGLEASALTPATAAQLLVTSDGFLGSSNHDWQDMPTMLNELPNAVLFRVRGNQAWIDKLAGTFKDLAKQISAGAPPRPQTLADEYALHTTISWASGTWEDMPPWEYLDGIERRPNDGDWNAVAAELSHFPFGFPDLTEDEIASHVGSDGRARLSRLHPYRWWESLDLALEEWRATTQGGAVSPDFIARALLDFIRHNRDVVDEIFEGDLYACELDTARRAVLLRDASGFTAVLTVAHPNVAIPPIDNTFQAFVYATAFLENLFWTREEQRMAECGMCGECEECELDWSMSDDVVGRHTWRETTGLLSAPVLVDHGDAERGVYSSDQAIGIKFNDNLVIRATIVSSD